MKTSHLIIQQDNDIRQVRQHFNDLYPYLKINFFLSRKNEKELNAHSIVFSDAVKLKEINPVFSGGDIEVSDDMSILDFENEFLRRFGLSVQVSRRSGNLWLDTTKTNQWSLKEQNDHGEAISPGFEQKPPFSEIPYGC